MTRSLARSLSPVVVGTALLLTLALAGCSSDDHDGRDDAASGSTAALDAPAADALEGAADAGGDAQDSAAQDSAARSVAQEIPQSVIRKGNVALRADDVGRAQIEVRKVVDRHAGEVTEEKTQSDDEGRPTYARMVLRIPSGDFGEAVEGLKKIGELESASTNEDDVTTQVIDVRTRLKVQQRSIARISVLFQRAQSIRDIMAIESELSRRQADLEALQQQEAYLADQTSLSTIVVSIDRTPAHQTKPEEDDTGFVAGLSAGWGALTTFAVGLATAVGALLPWVVVVAVLGVPALLLVRSVRRRAAARPAEPAQSSE